MEREMPGFPGNYQKKPARSIDRNQLMMDLVQAAAVNNLSIQKTHIVKQTDESGQEDKNEDDIKIFLRATCRFTDFIHFILSLDESGRSVFLGEMTLQAAHESEMLVTVNLLIYQRELQGQSSPFVKINRIVDPFDSLNNQAEFVVSDDVQDDEAQLRKVSIRQLRYAGFITQSNQTLALFKLNNRVISVTQKDKVGIESADILHVEDDQVVLRVHGRKMIVHLLTGKNNA